MRSPAGAWEREWKLPAVQAALHEEIAKLARDGLTADELDRAREKSLGQMEIRHQSNGAFAYQAALNELYGLGHSHHLTQRRELEALTVAEVAAATRRYFQQPAITAIVRPAG